MIRPLPIRQAAHAAAVGLLGIGATGVAGMAQAAPPTIALSCPKTAPEGLCSALIDTLAVRGPAYAMASREVTLAQVDLVVKLDLVNLTAFSLTARLIWNVKGNMPSVGPKLRLAVIDSDLTASMYPQYTNVLVNTVPNLAAVLSAQ